MCVYMYKYVCIYTYVYIYVYMCVCMYVCMCIYIYNRVCRASLRGQLTQTGVDMRAIRRFELFSFKYSDGNVLSTQFS